MPFICDTCNKNWKETTETNGYPTIKKITRQMMTLKQLPPASGLITRWSGPLGDIFRLQHQVEELPAILQRKNFVSNQYITPKTISKKKKTKIR